MVKTKSKEVTVRKNIINFASLLFNRMSEKHGGSTTLNELALLNYGFVCNAHGVDICVTKASVDLNMSVSTVSRILTGMRAKGFVTEESHPSDRRRRLFGLSEAYLDQGDTDIQMFIDWCREPGNSFV